MERKTVYKRITVESIRYMPALLLVACCVKIVLMAMSDNTHTPELTALHGINLFVSIVATASLYCIGRFLGMCWRHIATCVFAMIGYLMLIVFMVFHVGTKIGCAIMFGYMFAVLLWHVFHIVRSRIEKRNARNIRL